MLTFNKDSHTYEFNGKKLISVTQLMQKHGLAPDYKGVSQQVLDKKAEYGSFVHEEIDKWIKYKEIGFSIECQEFIDYTNIHQMKIVENEYQVYNDTVAGTFDLMFVENGTPIIADFKTTAKVHKEPVSWQLSIYLYLYLQMQKNPLLTKYEDFRGQCFHFGQDKRLKVINIPLKPIKMVQDLIESEKELSEYKVQLLDSTSLAEIEQVENVIKYYDQLKKEAEKRQAELKEAIMKAMTDNGIQEYDNGRIKLTLVDESERLTLDAKAIKEKYPEIYNNNLKTTKIKPNIRITIRGEKDE